MKLKDRMLDYRAKHGLSQEKAARQCDITLQTWTNIERGLQDPSRLTVAKIENVIGEEKED